jgi:hypothetical protein
MSQPWLRGLGSARSAFRGSAIATAPGPEVAGSNFGVNRHEVYDRHLFSAWRFLRCAIVKQLALRGRAIEF